MNWYVTTSVCVTIVLGQHVYVVKDYTVEVVNFHRLGKAGIHQNALVEAALVELFGQKDAVGNFLTSQKGMKIVQEPFQVKLAILVRNNNCRFRSWFAVSRSPAATFI